eukprot:scaffold13631_cov38-Cyclotella_meneghiniana.AAC.16
MQASLSRLKSQSSSVSVKLPLHFIIIIANMLKQHQPSYCPIHNYFKTHALDLSDEKRTKLVDHEWGYDTVKSLIVEADGPGRVGQNLRRQFQGSPAKNSQATI